jgi:predicted GNAT superfamily acetyltransferase
MMAGKFSDYFQLCVLETPQEMAPLEELQAVVWPGDKAEVVPLHVFLAASHNGGLVIGAYQLAEPGELLKLDSKPHSLANAGELPGNAQLVGFVFGFPGIYHTADGPRLKHHSHMMGVHPSVRDKGIGFALKRAQWQMIRHQEIDRITWTYDPLQSRNGRLNISRLGAVCNTYLRDAYGTMRDGLNAGLPSDRLQVDLWTYSQRVVKRLSSQPRSQLDLAHYLAAGISILNPSYLDHANLPRPADEASGGGILDNEQNPLVLLEIPADFPLIRAADLDLALTWRLHLRAWLERLFSRGYLITDFIYLPGAYARSFYVLSYGDSSL